MFPRIENTENPVAVVDETTISFRFDFEEGDFIVQDGKLVQCAGETALEVWIEKVLRTEKNRFKIYEGADYGIVIEDLLIGRNYSVAFIEAELRREIEDALLKNPLITGINSVAVERSETFANISIYLEADFGTKDMEVKFFV